MTKQVNVWLLLMALGWLTLPGTHLQGGESRIADSPQEVRPLLPGMKAPAVSFGRLGGGTLDLHQALNEKPALLIFYRGGW